MHGEEDDRSPVEEDADGPRDDESEQYRLRDRLEEDRRRHESRS